jgi:hypothetical protein
LLDSRPQKQFKEHAMLTAEVTYDWVEVMRAEYLEMPGLALSKPQARRLWGLDRDTCDVLLDEMVNERFLRKTAQNLYVRADIDR